MAKGRFNRVRHLFVICMRTETELALSLIFFNNVVGYHCTFFFPFCFLCMQHAHTHTHTVSTHRRHTQSNKCAHIFHTRTLYGIVSISVTAEGLATRDCAGLSRHGPDFTGYKGSRLPLVSNSVLDKKKKIFCLKKKKIADYHNRKIAAVQF